MESKGNVETKGIGLKGALGHKRESYFVKTIDSKLEEIGELKELVEKSEKLQEFYKSVFKLEGLELEAQSINHRFKTAKMFSPKSDEVKSLESLEELLKKFKADYTSLAGDISKTLEKYNSNNKKALDLFKIKNEQLINKIEKLNSE
ncbi:MAG: hypothetical protein HZC47_03350 [Methanobacterium sp.]|uniref:hypothetical protein n=1 Tax=Methanobacterium sp. TaxID=2164 RepID=UPI003D64E483|nr:hypothetical protein [Methanobacterium sp.]